MLLDGVRDAVVEKLPADVAVVRLSRPSSSLSRSLENEDEEVAITRELFLQVNSSNERYWRTHTKIRVRVLSGAWHAKEASVVAGLSG